MISAAYGHLEVVRVLLRTKLVDVNAQDIFGQSLVFWAAAQGHEDIVKLLLKAGADRNLEDTDGRTPLVMAKNYKLAKIVKMLSAE